ncbi:MAG: hypothetical protein PHR35_21705, partial [Kiritimatiellae bacterium]|nr:hypothetical protein [Kiritimatiellia bacterium]
EQARDAAEEAAAIEEAVNVVADAVATKRTNAAANAVRANATEARRRRRAKHRRTLNNFVSQTWGNLNRRCINGTHPKWNSRNLRSLKNGLRLELTRTELHAKVVEAWPVIPALWGAGQKVVLRRIDTRGPVSVANTRFCSLRESNRRTVLETFARRAAKAVIDNPEINRAAPAVPTTPVMVPTAADPLNAIMAPVTVSWINTIG